MTRRKFNFSLTRSRSIIGTRVSFVDKIFDRSRKMFHVLLYRFHCADFVDNYYICKNLMNCNCLSQDKIKTC